MTLFGKRLNLSLVLTVVLAVVVGSIVIYSASAAMAGRAGRFNLAYKQLIFAAGLILVSLFLFVIPMKSVMDMSWLLYFLSLGALGAVFHLGKTIHGAQRWITVGPLAFQPSELAKIAIIMALAHYMSRNRENKGRLRFIFFSTLIVVIPLGLIIKQPDLGTALTLIPILVTMLFMAGIPKRYFMLLLPFALIPLLILTLAKKGLIETHEIRNLLFFLKPYQQNRLLAFIDPNIDPRGMSYNLIQSQIAIGSGGMFGKGFMAGTQTHLRFLPERHTDFVFSVLGEEWGFVGACVLLALYLNIIRSALSIANRSQDYFPKLASAGIAMLLLFHVLTNIGMTIGLMPITGLPLPLISYGGSSLLTTLLAVGLLLNFDANRNQGLFP
jgi:rod shape determining protein RodA